MEPLNQKKMRPRAKSVLTDLPESQKSGGDQSLMEDEWNGEESMELIQKIFRQVPKDDNISYEERIQRINWELVYIENRSEEEVKKQFQKLLNDIRTFRTLNEILTDMANEAISHLPIPKRPISAFALFLQEKASEIKDKLLHNGSNVNVRGDFTRFAAETFKKLSDKEREEFEKRANDLKVNYRASLAKYKIGPQSGKKRSIRAKRLCPLVLFWEHLHDKNEEISYSEARKMYSKLSRKKKLKWILRYLNVKNDDKKKLNLEQYKMALDNLTKEEMSIVDEYEGRPKKMSGYSWFLKEYCTQIKEESKDGSWLQMASQKWQSLPKREKQRYEELAQTSKIQYSDAYIEFIKGMDPERQIFEVNGILHKAKGKRRTLSTSMGEESNLEESKSAKKEKSSVKQEDENVIAVVNTDISEKTLPNDNVFKAPLTRQHQREDIPEKSSKKHKRKKYTSDTDTTDQSANESIDSPQKSRNAKDTFIRSEDETYSKKNKRKRDVSVSDYSGNEGFTTPRKFKKEKNEESVENIILSKKPPSSPFKFYVKEMYKGPAHKAKETYKNLSEEEREIIAIKYRKANKKYSKLIKLHFTAEELENLKKREEISDDSQCSTP